MSAYNSQDTIEYAINSLLNQSYPNIEIVVCE
ncbi:glycosyltransferase family 2 protein [Avibacterium paragallinarum]|nr:glycosyltransferase family 2 protein [Avibacterium paragallinarum]